MYHTRKKKEKPIIRKNNFYREGGQFYIAGHSMKVPESKKVEDNCNQRGWINILPKDFKESYFYFYILGLSVN